MQAHFEPEQAFSKSMPQPVFEISIAYECIIMRNDNFNNKSYGSYLKQFCIEEKDF